MPDMDLQQHRVGPLDSVAYVADYLSPAEEAALLRQFHASKAWRHVAGRRVQSLGGLVTPKGRVPAPLPPAVAALAERVSRLAAPAFGGAANHVLVNAYPPTAGILPHEDGPAYAPGAAIISLGAPAILRFYPKCDGGGAPAAPVESMALMPRSLVVFWRGAYTAHLHGVDAPPDGVEDVDATVANAAACGLAAGARLPRGGERLSLTVRRVPRELAGLALRGARWPER